MYHNEFEKKLQYGFLDGCQSYKVMDDFIYTYGSTGFVFVNLQNADVSIVLRDDFTKNEIEGCIAYYTDVPADAKMTVPKFIFLQEEELDEEKHKIMEELKKEIIPFDRKCKLYNIFDSEWRKKIGSNFL